MGAESIHISTSWNSVGTRLLEMCHTGVKLDFKAIRMAIVSSRTV